MLATKDRLLIDDKFTEFGAMDVRVLINHAVQIRETLEAIVAIWDRRFVAFYVVSVQALLGSRTRLHVNS